MLQVFGSVPAKMAVHVHLYRQLHSDVDFSEAIFANEAECTDLRADVHIENEINFEVYVEDANEEVDVGIALKSVRDGIDVGLSVTVVVKLGVVIDLNYVGES